MSALIGGAAYLMYQQSNLSIQHIECQQHLKNLVNESTIKEILDDMKIELTPYYVYYYNLLKALEDEFADNLGSKERGLRSATLHALKLKI